MPLTLVDGRHIIERRCIDCCLFWGQWGVIGMSYKCRHVRTSSEWLSVYRSDTWSVITRDPISGCGDTVNTSCRNICRGVLAFRTSVKCKTASEWGDEHKRSVFENRVLIRIPLHWLHRASYNILFILSNLDTHIQFVDFKLSPRFEYCICSFGYFPGVSMWYADVSEPCISSIFKGWK